MPNFSRLAVAAACAMAFASAAFAQKVQSVPAQAAPSAAARSAQSAPNPAGLRSTFPAGVTSGSGGAVSPNPIAQSTTVIPANGNRVSAGPGLDNNLPGNVNGPDTGNNTAVMGAGAGVRGPGQAVGGAGGFSATDTTRSFFMADANKDGELTRAEAARLSIMTMTFEEMDRNFDGVISRFEYADSVR
ncbi:EF-hand domain-containing protein [Ramlibacter sp. PS3R-8]|uniref:EF-hand domain-containing protein n=1 Tax=Ramlibacter sp. PS3R-8 TaxID=3133437 RepID=UPI0030A249E4